MSTDESQTLPETMESLTELAEQLEPIGAFQELQELLRTAISNLRSQQSDLERREAELATLQDVGHVLNSTLELPQVLHRIVAMATELLETRACTLRLLEDDGELRLHASYNLSHRYLGKGPVNTQGSMVQHMALQGQTVYIEDVSRDERIQYPKQAAQEGLHSMLCTGLPVRGRPIGAMSVYTDEVRTFTSAEVHLFESLANQAALAIEHARLHSRELEAHEMERELEIAGQIQMNLIPKTAPSIPHLDIAARLDSYRDVSGDFYDFIMLPDENFGFVIADVSGKSVAGALIMSETRAVLRTRVEHVYSVKDVVASVNRLVSEDTRISEFVTLFYGVVDLDNHVLTYTNAGHIPPLLFRKGECLTLESGGMILGFQQDAEYTETQIPLQTDDLIVCVTDGITEATNHDYDLFDIERLQKLIQTHRHQSAEEIVQEVYRALEIFTEGQLTDDATVLVLKVTD